MPAGSSQGSPRLPLTLSSPQPRRTLSRAPHLLMSLCYLLFDRCVNKADSHSTPHYSLVNPVTPHHQGHCSLLTSWWAVYCSGESDYFNGEIFVMQWYCSSFYTSVSNFSVEDVALNCWVIQRDSSQGL